MTFSCGFKVVGRDLMLIIVGDAAEVACLLGPACGSVRLPRCYIHTVFATGMLMMSDLQLRT